MKALKWLFYVIVLVAIVIVGGSFVLPSQVTVTRSTEIAAPPEKVFAIVGDYRRFTEFSPWADIDPNTKYTIEGPDGGVGQKMTWQSDNPDVRTGSQTIVEYQAPSLVKSALDLGPMGKPTATWNLEPAGAGTKATWTLDSPLDGMVARWLGFLMFETWVGAEYEKGLARLKVAAEKP